MGSLFDKMDAEREIPNDSGNRVVKAMVGSKREKKTKRISAAVRPSVFNAFQEVCIEQGLSVNTVIDVMMANYVREHKED